LWFWGEDLHLNPLCSPYISIVFPTIFLSILIRIYSSSPNIFDAKSFRLGIVSLLVIVLVETFYWFGREWRINKITNYLILKSLFTLGNLMFLSSPWKTFPFSHFLPWIFFFINNNFLDLNLSLSFLLEIFQACIGFNELPNEGNDFILHWQVYSIQCFWSNLFFFLKHDFSWCFF